MAHFARVEGGVVSQVIVVNNEDCGGGDFPESEPIGQTFIAGLGLEGEWVQCSYNNSFRKQYPNVGDFYSAEGGSFYRPQPFPSWSLDTDYNWQPPIPYPEDGHDYWWDEDEKIWVQFESPIGVSDD